VGSRWSASVSSIALWQNGGGQVISRQVQAIVSFLFPVPIAPHTHPRFISHASYSFRPTLIVPPSCPSTPSSPSKLIAHQRPAHCLKPHWTPAWPMTRRCLAQARCPKIQSPRLFCWYLHSSLPFSYARPFLFLF
jgi:hypothetical protein